MILIREEVPADYAVRMLNRQAFAGGREAQLVDDLRSEEAVVASVVAVDDSEIVGHIMFSDLLIDSDHKSIRAVSLAPMAVAPRFQRRGVGSALVRRGLELCRDRGKTIVVVLGHPQYYPRFGFSAELAKSLHSPYSAAGSAWMVFELLPGALQGITGTVKYPKAFNGL